MERIHCDWSHNHPKEEAPPAQRLIGFVVNPQETVSEFGMPEIPASLRLCDSCASDFRERVVGDPSNITLDIPLDSSSASR